MWALSGAFRTLKSWLSHKYHVPDRHALQKVSDLVYRLFRVFYAISNIFLGGGGGVFLAKISFCVFFAFYAIFQFFLENKIVSGGGGVNKAI